MKRIKNTPPLKAIIADDSDDIHLIVKNFLSDLNIDSHSAYNGLEAIEKLKSSLFDILIIDYHMPQMNGDEVISHIRTKLQSPHKDIPILGISSSAVFNEISQFMNSGANAFLSKPFNLYSLKSKLEHILNHEIEIKKTKQTNKLKAHEDFQYINLSLIKENINNDDSLISEMIKVFISIVPETLSNFEKYINEENWQGLKNTAHKYYSQVSYMGIVSIKDDLKMIEIISAGEKDIKKVKDILPYIIKISNNAVQELKIIIEK